MPETYTFARRPPEQEFAAIERQCRTSVDTILGRSTANGRALEEIACTAAGRALLDDANASAQRTTLGLGTAALKDYDEGTWTPADASGAGLTFSTVSATYERIGRLVIARFDLQYPATADGTAASVGGLPFTVANAQDARQGFISVGTAPSLRYAWPNANATTLAFYTTAGAAIVNSTLSSIRIAATLMYRA